MNLNISQAQKEKFLLYFVVVLVIFLVFYWTHMFFQSRQTSMVQQQVVLTERINKAAELIAEISSGAASSKTVTTGLLSFIQNTAASAGIGNRILDLKPIQSSGSTEVVSLRIEALNLYELNSFLGLVEGYQNLGIKNFTLKKRFDNPQLADITLEIVKNK